MMYLNTIQEAVELAKSKPKIAKAQKRQREIEKDGEWVLVTGDFKEYRKFVPNKKKK